MDLRILTQLKNTEKVRNLIKDFDLSIKVFPNLCDVLLNFLL
jgi:hypothetical protein